MLMNNNPIGIFDSGIGGLTVTREIIKLMPNESIIYLGDTARVPYGPRSKEVITKFALEMVNFLLRRKVKFLIVACNTISAVAYEEIKRLSPVPILGVLKPAVAKAAKVSKNGKIGVIGTVGTIKSNAYGKLLKSFRPDAQIFSCACPLFVPLAEEGLNHHQATKLVAKEYLGDLISKRVDTLILGCTHYPLLLDTIKETIGDGVIIIDSSRPTAQMLKERLKEADLLNKRGKASYHFFVTDAPERVFKVASRFFGEKINGRLKKINLGN